MSASLFSTVNFQEQKLLLRLCYDFATTSRGIKADDANAEAVAEEGGGEEEGEGQEKVKEDEGLTCRAPAQTQDPQ